jgi:ubiquinone/menaquinone biosynthesis C-methylase UbiE
MAAGFRIRDMVWPRRIMLAEVGIEPGMCVLDYGCGPGSYVPAAAELVGEAGRVCALDRHPLAAAAVRRRVARGHLTNVTVILSDCGTGLDDREVDVGLLYDVLHCLDDPREVLKELHRVVKREGLVSVSDHHLSEQELVSRMTEEGRFRFLQRGRWTYGFAPAPS